MELEYQEIQVQPGPCPLNPETGLPECPPPTASDVIAVQQVFSDRTDLQIEEIAIPFEAPTLELVTTEAQQAECVATALTYLNCAVLNENDLVRVLYTLEVTSRVPLDEGGYELGSETRTITRILTLPRASEDGLSIQCQILPVCLFCYISERDDLGNVTKVTCSVEVVIILMVLANMLLLIPNYGF